MEDKKIEIIPNVVYTTKEVCNILGITPWFLGDLIKRGRIKPISLGNRYRWDSNELIRFLKDETQKGAQAH